MQVNPAESKEKTENPYVSPSSNLIDESDVCREWDEFTIKCAENFCRCLVFGRILALSSFAFVKFAVDTALHGWEELIQTSPASLTLTVVCPMVLIAIVPGVKLYVYYRRRTNTLRDFIEDKAKELRSLFNQPWATTMLMLLTCLMLIVPQDLIRDLWDPEVTWPTVRSLSLLVIPLVLPISYFIVRAAQQKARYWLERMSEET